MIATRSHPRLAVSPVAPGSYVRMMLDPVLAIGTVAGTTCTHLSGGAVNTPAGTAPQLTGTANAGTYCIDIYDVGNQTGSITYTVAVAHP